MADNLGLEQLEDPVEDAGWSHGLDEFLVGPFLPIPMAAEKALKSIGVDPSEGTLGWKVQFKNGKVVSIIDAKGKKHI